MSILLYALVACNPPLPVDTGSAPDDTGDTDVDDTGDTDTDTDTDTAPPDDDGDDDGYSVADGDCDDADPTRHPDAPEALDGDDDDCSGAVDDGDVTAFEGSARVEGAGSGFGYGMVASPDAGSGSEYVAIGARGGTGNVYVFDTADVVAGTSALDARYTLAGSGGQVGAFLLYTPLDADTYADLVVGDPTYGGGGAVHLLDGARVRSGGFGTVDAVTRRIDGDDSGLSGFGRSLAVAGGQLFVGAPAESAARGAFYTFDAAGAARGDFASYADGGRVAPGTEIGLGFALSRIDWDRDGVDDLVVSAPGSTGGGLALAAGRALVWAAEDLPALAAGGDTSSAVASIEGHVARAYLGHLAVGDFDGDGGEELALGSWIAPECDERRIVVVEGDATGAVSTDDARLTVTGFTLPTDDPPGMAVADVDGDGIADLLAGDFGNSPGRALVFGSGSVLLGGALEPTDASISIDGPALGDTFGATLLGLSVPGGGADDLLIAAPTFGDGAAWYVPSAF